MTWVAERHKGHHFNAKDNLQNIICFKPFRELSSQGHHDNWIPNGDKSLLRWLRFVISSTLDRHGKGEIKDDLHIKG